MIPLKITSLAKLTSIGFAGMPSIWTLPPTRTRANAWWIAECTPDISSTTSTPYPPVARLTRSSASLGCTTSWAPMRLASARRVGFTSEAMIRDAPAALQMPTAKMPIGPQPVIRTVAPGMSAVSAVWKAFPIGSWMPPTSKEMLSSRCQMLVAGIAM